jgi:hypothetical protein
MKRRLGTKGFVMLLVSAFCLVPAGCGAGKTLVMKPTEATFHARSVEITEEEPTVKATEKARQYFLERLETLLYEDGGFEKGSTLKISYRFIQFNPGSQLTRWFWGGVGNAGEGTVTVEAKFYIGEEEVSFIQVEGKIQSGAFGGDFNFAIEKAAREIATYTLENFK